jgi:cytochrome c oxidase subunit III
MYRVRHEFWQPDNHDSLRISPAVYCWDRCRPGTIAWETMSVVPVPADHRLRQGGQLFLVALNVFFLAGMILYLLLATWRRNQFQIHSIPYGFLESTLLLVVTSGALIAALRAVRRERLQTTIRYLIIALLGGLAFLLVQSFAMKELIVAGITRAGSQGLWGMVVTLAVLHALHIAGGLIGLAMILVSAFRHRYDHERHWPIEFVGTYWHFLDIVWVCMLFTFWMTSSGFGT